MTALLSGNRAVALASETVLAMCTRAACSGQVMGLKKRDREHL